MPTEVKRYEIPKGQPSCKACFGRGYAGWYKGKGGELHPYPCQKCKSAGERVASSEKLDSTPSVCQCPKCKRRREKKERWIKKEATKDFSPCA